MLSAVKRDAPLSRNIPPRRHGSNWEPKRSEPPADEPLFDMGQEDGNSPVHPSSIDNLYDRYLPSGDDERSAPSLPIILLSAASGVSSGIIALYITYNWLSLPIEWSVAAAVFCLSIALGSTGALLSLLTGSRAAVLNIAFSCGLILVTLLFFALCTFIGAIAATFILTL